MARPRVSLLLDSAPTSPQVALEMLFRTLAAAEPGVTCILIRPGTVDTRLGRNARSTIPGLPEHIIAGTPVATAVREMVALLSRRAPGDSGKRAAREPEPRPATQRHGTTSLHAAPCSNATACACQLVVHRDPLLL